MAGSRPGPGTCHTLPSRVSDPRPFHVDPDPNLDPEYEIFEALDLEFEIFADPNRRLDFSQK